MSLVGKAMGEIPLLEITDLSVSTGSEESPVRLVDGVTFQIRAGEVVGLVGESGSGKSLTMASVTGLLPAGTRIADGQVLWRGTDLTDASASRLRSVRGGEIGTVFQDPARALDPLMRVGSHLVEAIRLHHPEIARRHAWTMAVDALAAVGVPDPQRRAKQYPHEFSGGMRQRVMIAIALVNRPALVIADEPTTALDVTVQAQVLDVLRAAREEDGTAVVLITHDLGLIAEIADRVTVMYAGRIVETGTVLEVFGAPRHPYTRALLESRPHLAVHGSDLPAIAGQPPMPAERPLGCAFAPRCPEAIAECEVQPPALIRLNAGRAVACHLTAPGALKSPKGTE